MLVDPKSWCIPLIQEIVAQFPSRLTSYFHVSLEALRLWLENRFSVDKSGEIPVTRFVAKADGFSSGILWLAYHGRK